MIRLPKRHTHIYTGPTLLSDAAGKVGVKHGTHGWVVEQRDDGMVEFVPSWGADWLSVLLPATEVIPLEHSIR